MFTEIGENVVETKEEPAATDLDFVIGKLSISPVANGSSCIRVDEVSDTMVRPNVSGSDALVSAFDSIGLAVGPEQGSEIANIATGADCFAPICGSDPPLLKPDDGKDTGNSDSSNFASISEQSAQMDGTAEVVDEDKASEPNNPLIVYTSSRRRSVRNNKSHLNNDSEKPSRIPRKMASKKSVVDLNSLQILRRRRSLFSQRVRSSAWGSVVNILTDPEEPSGRDVNLGNKKKTRKVKGGQGNRNANRDQTGRKAAQKSCLPTRPISLKIRIGNRSYGMGNATESVDASGKSIPGLFDISESKLVEEVHGDAEFPLESNLKKVMSTDASSLGAHLDTRDSVENLLTSSDHHQFVIQDGHDDLGGNADNRCSDPGTSPDSEVINSVPEVPTFEKGLYNTLESPIMSKACASFGDVSSFSSLQMNSKNRKKKDKHHQLGDGSVEDNPAGVETRTDTEVPAEHGLEHKVVDVPYSGGPLRRFGPADSGAALTTSNLCGGAEPSASFGIFAPFGSSNSGVGGESITCSNGQKPSKSSRAKGGSKSRSGVSELPSKKDKASKKKGNRKNVVGKHQINEKGNAGDILNGVEDHQTAENHISSSLGENGDLSNGSNAAINSFQSPSTWLKGPDAPPRNAWVLCDECQKWRRIAAKLADLIEETNCQWTCKDNADKEFADCSIPQEKSNSEINDELEISDASCEEDGSDPFRKSSRSQPKVPPLQSPWKLIKSNVFLHRSRKTQTIDEVMVCHCKPPSDGRMGCGAKCLNRMLNIECVRGTCPCGELCSNQQFQKRKYAKLKWFRCGKKGFGLQALQDISEGQFLIEYVGEVLDIHAYEARQRDYALKGHKHFYFMTLNGSEVIDACARGNLGRYINHSCDPNCRTEKWMVNGEVCVGLFAISDIKKGEEVTFDYNYVRVFGAAAKKCVCGSSNCRGYIGGDLTNSEVIVQEDSDDEDSEPVMICEDKEMNDDWNDIMKHSSYEREKKYANELQENTHGTKEVVNAAGSETLFQKVEDIDSGQTDGCLEISTAVKVVDSIAQDKSETGDFVCNDSVSDAVGQFDTNRDTGESLEISASTPFKVETEDLPPQMHPSTELMDITQKSMKISLRTVLEPEMTTSAIPGKSRAETVESKRKLKHEIVEGREAKPNIIAKTRRSSSSIKKGKPKSNSVSEKVTPDVDKSSVTLHKSKKLPDLTLKNHVETVEEKLNELLDTEGGISKRKDASRGYLKLLFLTAASGNNHGETIQSNRDLSMILDALLKTKSRTVLVDIINKNGLQMLHNIMKRYRKEFNKTPILRKLLKVLEYLALREILTLEHITGGPPCAGVESFRDSILTLTEHADKQVHQIARNFRDRWIPRHLRRNCCMEIDDGRTEFHPRSTCGSNRFGKLPSGLDDCSETQSAVASGTVETPTEDPSPASVSISGITARKRKSRWDTPAEDIPPGFSSPCHGSTGPGVQSSTVPDQPAVLGDSQERFRAHIPLCYGIPASVMQQFGAESAVGWSIAPGFSFQPFPPLPPTSAASKSMERAEQGSDTVVAHHCGEKRTIECVTGPQEVNSRAANDGPGSYTLERKYFRQQKWNHPKLPPWVRMRNGWGV